MHVLVADPDLEMELPDRLLRAGWTLSRDLDEAEAAPDVALIGIAIAQDPTRVHEVRLGLGDTPLLVAARVPPPALNQIEEHVAGLILPAFAEPRSAENLVRHPTPRLVPVTTFGPAEGLPWRFHRQAVSELREAGIPVALHGDMQAWLTSTAAWMTPLREAMLVAAACGSDLRFAPDLVALAARAGRDRIGLMRRAGLPLESRARWLYARSESLAIEAFERLAARAQAGSAPAWLPTVAEVIVSSRLFRQLRDVHFGGTPAADVLDDLVLELATRNGGTGRPFHAEVDTGTTTPTPDQ